MTNTTLNVIGEPLGIFSLSHQGVLNVYPNPSAETLNVHYYGGAVPNRFYVKDMLGRSVQIAIVNKNEFRIDAAMLAAGTYTLELRNENLTLARGKFAVTR